MAVVAGAIMAIEPDVGSNRNVFFQEYGFGIPRQRADGRAHGYWLWTLSRRIPLGLDERVRPELPRDSSFADSNARRGLSEKMYEQKRNRSKDD